MTNRFRALRRAPLLASGRLRWFGRRTGHAVFWFGLLAAVAQPLQARDFRIGEIAIENPWSRETPAGAKVAAGYLALRNEGSEPDRLVAVSAGIAGRSAVHEMGVSAEGVMTMRPVTDGFEIPAGTKVELAPGSFHIMFENLKHPLKAGDTFSGTLTFAHAGTVEVTFAVDAMAGRN